MTVMKSSATPGLAPGKSPIDPEPTLIDAQVQTSSVNGGIEKLAPANAMTEDLQRKGTKSTTENTTTIEAMVLQKPSKCNGTKAKVVDSAAASITHSPVEDAPTIDKVSKFTPCLENIMTWGGVLQWSLSEIRGFAVGDFKVVDVISAKGANGLVVSCTDAANNLYAMKIERKSNSMNIDNIALSEVFYSCLNKGENDLYIPRLKASFRELGREISVMELLGPDLRALLSACQCTSFSPKTTMQIGLSLITAYEQIHRSRWLHLTTKPINFCIGGTPETRHKVYAIDFGRAQEYIVRRQDGREVHRSKRTTGVASSCLFEEFSSVWGDANMVPSRRDDMMSLALMLMYLEGRVFPWTQKGLSKLAWIIWSSIPRKYTVGVTYCVCLEYEV